MRIIPNMDIDEKIETAAMINGKAAKGAVALLTDESTRDVISLMNFNLVFDKIEYYPHCPEHITLENDTARLTLKDVKEVTEIEGCNWGHCTSYKIVCGGLHTCTYVLILTENNR